MNNLNRSGFIPVFLACIMIIVTACGSNNAKEVPVDPVVSVAADTLFYEMRNVEKIFGNKSTANEQEVYCKCSYPVFSGGSPVALINSVLHSWIADSTAISPGEGYTGDRSIESLAANFFHEYESVIKEFGSIPGYQFDLNGSVLLNRNGLLTVNLASESYTGGAHGNSVTQMFVFDVRSGKRLSVRDLFVAGFEDRLNRLIDSRYRQMRGLSKTERLDSEKGQLFENVIRFNDNVALTTEGVTFFYNNYEIAAYAYGPTEITLPYSAVADILKPEFMEP